MMGSPLPKPGPGKYFFKNSSKTNSNPWIPVSSFRIRVTPHILNYLLKKQSGQAVQRFLAYLFIRKKDFEIYVPHSRFRARWKPALKSLNLWSEIHKSVSHLILGCALESNRCRPGTVRDRRFKFSQKSTKVEVSTRKRLTFLWSRINLVYNFP